MQIPIVSGIYRSDGQLQPSYPVNLIPTPKGTGVSNMFLRPAEGLDQYATGMGNDRAAIVWRGIHYRVSGSYLISVAADGSIVNLGYVGGAGPATMDYGFDHLMIVSGGNAYYYDGSTLAQLTDPDLGLVVDGCWIDGYYLYTDGKALIVTEINDPFSVNPLKYGSSESDPDPIIAVKRIRTEVSAINRYTIEAFDNVGGDLFPLQRIDGAMATKGAISKNAVCVFNDSLVFVGGGKSESLGVYISQNSQSEKISTSDIDILINSIPESQWASIQIESRLEASHQWIYVHLPDRTVVFDFAASKALETPVWFNLTSTLDGFSQYLARNFVWVGNSWKAGNPIGFQIGALSTQKGHHWGDPVRWEFSTSIISNKTAGGIVSKIELEALTGDIDLMVNPRIRTSYSQDGETWSMPKSIPAGLIGNRIKRLAWLQQGMFRKWRIQRFQGDSYAHISPVALDAQLESMVW